MALSKIETASLDIGQIGGRRNLIINGAMQVAQRGTSSTSNGYATVDRIKTSNASAQLAYTQEQAYDGPAGFAKSYKFTVTTPETTLDSSDVVYIKHAVEANNVQHLGFGTNEAKPITLSFWVKSSVVGDYAFTIWQEDGNKGYNVAYTITSANAWEYKTITFPGNTADAIGADNGIGFDLYFALSSGSTYKSNSSMRDTWATYTSAGFAYGQTADVMTTNGATWQITGVQLEVDHSGTGQASPFEHRSYAEELQLCQRYFQNVENAQLSGARNTGTRLRLTAPLHPQMRTNPTISRVSGTTVVMQTDGSSLTSTSTSVAQGTTAGVKNLAFDLGSFSGATDRSYVGASSYVGTAVFTADAEL